VLVVARKKRRTKNPAKTLGIQPDSDLLVRLGKISEQIGLSPQDLLQKWVLQEETLIGIMQRCKGQTAEQAAHSNVAQTAKAAPLDSGSPDYRQMLVKKVKKLKKEGMTFKKIAETFNDEKVPTVSGTGNWYSSSVAWLLSAKNVGVKAKNSNMG